MLERLDRLLGFRWLYTRYRQFVTGGVFLKTQECPVDEIERYKRGANAMQVGGKALQETADRTVGLHRGQWARFFRRKHHQVHHAGR